MGTFFVYILKSAFCLALFYLFQRLLLSRDTFHRFNRFALLGILLFSALLPFVRLTLERPAEVHQTLYEWELFLEEASDMTTTLQAATPTLSWTHCLLAVYLLGILFFLGRNLYSLAALTRQLRTCAQEPVTRYVATRQKVRLLVHEGDMAPFSWLNIIVVARKDLEENGREILLHELSHIGHRHSFDLLLADLCCFLQWFNPAAWLLKQELQTIHEYEADDSVLRQGIDAKKYQLLLIRKAVGTRLYSMANSFNHSSLKKRITMMWKEKTSPWARLKYIYVLPVAAVAISAFARPEVAKLSEDLSAAKVNDFVAIVEAKATESAAPQPAAVPMPPAVQPQDTVKAKKSAPASSEAPLFEVVENMPEFPGGLAACMKWLGENMRYPEEAKAKGTEGRVTVRFIVDTEGKICQPEVLRGVDPLLDAEAIRVVSSMPAWQPGTQRGQKVRVRFTLPVLFRLSKPEAATAPLEDGLYEVVENMPEFPGGGMAACMKWIQENMRYPEEAKEKGMQGRVTVQFIVDKEGNICDPFVLRSVDPLFDAEALRLVSSMPAWKPGTSKGQKVRVRFTLPVMFRLDSPTTKTQERIQIFYVDSAVVNEKDLDAVMYGKEIKMFTVKNGTDGEKLYYLSTKAKGESDAQETMKVEGTVRDKSGNPIIGAVVQLIGTKDGSVTDTDGRFAMKVPAEGSKLKISYVGMKSTIIEAAPGLTIFLSEE